MGLPRNAVIVCDIAGPLSVKIFRSSPLAVSRALETKYVPASFLKLSLAISELVTLLTGLPIPIARYRLPMIENSVKKMVKNIAEGTAPARLLLNKKVMREGRTQARSGQ